MSETNPDPPTPEPETPPETPPESPPSPEPESPPGDEPTLLEKARREARGLRAQLKTEREQHEAAMAKALEDAKSSSTDEIEHLKGQLLERDAMLAGVGKFRDPRDVARYIDVHDTPPDEWEAAIAKVLSERPYLAAVNGAQPLPQGQQSEPAANGDAAADWLRKVMTRQPTN